MTIENNSIRDFSFSNDWQWLIYFVSHFQSIIIYIYSFGIYEVYYKKKKKKNKKDVKVLFINDI